MVMIQVAWLVAGSGTRGSLIVSRQHHPRPGVVRAGRSTWPAVWPSALLVTLMGGRVIHAGARRRTSWCVQILAFSVAIYGIIDRPAGAAAEEPPVQAPRGRQCRRGDAGLGDRGDRRAAGGGRVGAGGRQILYQALLAAFGWAWARRLLPAPSAVPAGPDWRALARPAGSGLVLRPDDDQLRGAERRLRHRRSLHRRRPAGALLAGVHDGLCPHDAVRLADRESAHARRGAHRADRTLSGRARARRCGSTAALLFPCVPPAIVLAPVLLPGPAGAGLASDGGALPDPAGGRHRPRRAGDHPRVHGRFGQRALLRAGRRGVAAGHGRAACTSVSAWTESKGRRSRTWSSCCRWRPPTGSGARAGSAPVRGSSGARCSGVLGPVAVEAAVTVADAGVDARGGRRCGVAAAAAAADRAEHGAGPDVAGRSQPAGAGTLDGGDGPGGNGGVSSVRTPIARPLRCVGRHGRRSGSPTAGLRRGGARCSGDCARSSRRWRSASSRSVWFALAFRAPVAHLLLLIFLTARGAAEHPEPTSARGGSDKPPA